MERTYEHKTHPVLKGLKIFGYVILGALAAAFFGFVFGYFVMLLWNWLMPALFSITTITFWQAVGIVVLARLLFGGFKHGESSHSKKRSPKKKFYEHWKEECKKRCDSGDWKYLDDYWSSEGEKAYDEYIERRKEQDQK